MPPSQMRGNTITTLLICFVIVSSRRRATGYLLIQRIYVWRASPSVTPSSLLGRSAEFKFSYYLFLIPFMAYDIPTLTFSLLGQCPRESTLQPLLRAFASDPHPSDLPCPCFQSEQSRGY